MNNDPEFYTMIAKMICNEMQQVPIDWGLSYVPFIADAKVGTRWGYTSKVKF